MAETETKDMNAGEMYPLYGATSFAELDQLRASEETAMKASELTAQFQMLVSNVMNDAAISNKGPALSRLTSEFTDRLNQANRPKERTGLIAKLKEFLVHKELPADPLPVIDRPSFTVWKDKTGAYRWFAVYSNKFRDEDSPPEIISEKSHKAFTALVDAGELDYPELWHWHIPGSTWGKADWLDYADGFAMASGYILPGHEKEAEALSQMDDIRVSHGMPSRFIVRSKQDPTVIDFHVTTEISDLPGFAAANPLTEFAVLKESDMALTPEKRNYLVEAGLDDDQIKAIEVSLSAKGKAAQEAGIESKEAATPATETPAAETPATPPQYATVQEIATAIGDVMKPITDAIAGINAQIATMAAEVKALKEIDEAKIAKAAALTPRASLQELIATRIIGNPDAQIDGRSSLAKAGPKQAATDAQITGVPFLDNLIQQAQGSVK